MGNLLKTQRIASGGASSGFSYTYSVASGVRESTVNKIKQLEFIESGTLTLKTDMLADVFIVGGGGAGRYGGGGGGYTKTIRGVQLTAGTEYPIVIGSGGVGATTTSAYSTDGGESSAFGYSASGGVASGKSSNDKTKLAGGAGGSGGGSGASSDYGSKGGNGGSNGFDGSSAGTSGGVGQGYTTRAFEEENGTLYAGGGGGMAKSTSYTFGLGGEGGGGDAMYEGDAQADPNTGGGGGGTYVSGGSKRGGGSGIVIIRRHIPIKNNLYLYSAGNQHTGITGDWAGIKRDPTGSYSSTDRAPVITPSDTSIYADNTGTVCGAFYTALKIDMTPYKTLVFEGEFKRSGTYGSGFMPGVWSAMTGNANGTTRLAYTQQEDSDKDKIFNRYEVDVSSVEEHGHVGINLANAYANVTACYLVPKDD